ncbi:hypothetical protein GCM10025870_28690 [Agromyces marinus]|uniref:Uncharacterized protein n=1 Tax=Agromyces marinus TaxID=1389020 RepID=A0ABM8H4U7_9MICO|nr:hypothetical protein GCM10025870_28690 [Agromyces marinus]
MVRVVRADRVEDPQGRHPVAASEGRAGVRRGACRAGLPERFDALDGEARVAEVGRERVDRCEVEGLIGGGHACAGHVHIQPVAARDDPSRARHPASMPAVAA